MSSLKHTIESHGYTYETDPLAPGAASSQTYLSVDILKLYLHFAEAFDKANKEWEKKCAVEPELSSLSSYLYSAVVGMDGAPIALIAYVDDIPQVFEIRQGDRIEESK